VGSAGRLGRRFRSDCRVAVRRHGWGAAAFAGLTITANILMSLLIERFGLLGMEIHELNSGRIAGAALMVAGIALISKF
jgi:transporter family-2 protein